MSQLGMADGGDLIIDNNNFTIVKETIEIRQRLFQNLRTFLGEWFLDSTIGVPYFQIVFVKGTAPTAVDAVFKDAIIQTEGVVNLTKFSPADLDVGTRTADLTFEVEDDFGNIFYLDAGVP